MNIDLKGALRSLYQRGYITALNTLSLVWGTVTLLAGFMLLRTGAFLEEYGAVYIMVCVIAVLLGAASFGLFIVMNAGIFTERIGSIAIKNRLGSSLTQSARPILFEYLIQAAIAFVLALGFTDILSIVFKIHFYYYFSLTSFSMTEFLVVMGPVWILCAGAAVALALYGLKRPDAMARLLNPLEAITRWTAAGVIAMLNTLAAAGAIVLSDLNLNNFILLCLIIVIGVFILAQWLIALVLLQTRWKIKKQKATGWTVDIWGRELQRLFLVVIVTFIPAGVLLGYVSTGFQYKIAGLVAFVALCGVYVALLFIFKGIGRRYYWLF